MPVVKFDLHDEFAGYHLLALMLWPRDKNARDQYISTWGAKVQHSNECKFEAELEKSIYKKIVEQVGEDRAREMLVKLNRDEMRRQAAAAVRALNNQVYDQFMRPAGGVEQVANAIGFEAINQSAAKNGRKFGAACGAILYYIASIEKYHPDIQASSNRATWIMRQRAEKNGG